MIICEGVRVGEHDLNQSQVFHGMSQIEIIRKCLMKMILKRKQMKDKAIHQLFMVIV